MRTAFLAQGELEIKTEVSSGGPLALLNGHTEAKVEKVPFFMLGLDLPPAPLYKDKDKKDIIPQVGMRLYLLYQLLPLPVLPDVNTATHNLFFLGLR